MMKSPALYLFEVFFCSGMLMAFYRLLLARKVSCAVCRHYLVAAVFLSVVIPAFDIPLYPVRVVSYPQPVIATGMPRDAGELFVPVPDERSATISNPAPVAPAVDWGQVGQMAGCGLYLLTVAVLLGIFIIRIVGIRRLRRGSRLTDCGTYVLAENSRVETPFSFLRTVFLGEDYESPRRQIVLCHEASHVRHRHSLERIAIELVRSIFWFNPFVWMAGRWLQEVQEWEADRDVLDAGYDLTQYRTVIFRQLFGYNPDIACGLNHSFTKNRFAMMTQRKECRHTLWRLGAALPVVAGIILLCSFTVRTPDTPTPETPARYVSRVHIGSGGKMTFNGRPVTAPELERFIAAEREKLSEADRAEMVVVLQADEDTPVNDLSGAMDASRRANALRLQLCTDASDSGVVRMLPPDPSRLPADSKVKVIVPGPKGFAGTLRIRERNLFLVHVDASGAITAGQAFREKNVSEEELPALIRDFVLNADDDPALSEKQEKEFDLPGGGVMRYPVSKGIVVLDTAPAASFGRYLKV